MNGIKEKITAVVDTVKGIGNSIKSFLGFSVPDKGPLHEYETWMPDFMQGLAKGINENKDKLLDAVKTVSGDMSMLVQSAIATPETAGASSVSNRSIVQNVNYSNTFNGDRAGQQKSAGAMAGAAKDTTAELARGLAYAR